VRPVAVRGGLVEAGGAQAFDGAAGQGGGLFGRRRQGHHLQPPAGALDGLDEGARPRLDPTSTLGSFPGRPRGGEGAARRRGVRKGEEEPAGLLAVAGEALAGDLERRDADRGGPQRTAGAVLDGVPEPERRFG